MPVLILFIIVIALMTLSLLVNGWAFSILWGWFLVPLGLSELSIPTAIGMALIVQLLTYRASSEQHNSTKEAFIRSFSAPLLALGIGWVVQAFV